ncbi:histone H2A type 2-C-like [Pogoniulus pusillus]|uniref:histone H2A type 2-C-like n=1 Tax=Pogoniulus pusillus TaxID=488313 RepID=UPI0030B98D42
MSWVTEHLGMERFRLLQFDGRVLAPERWVYIWSWLRTEDLGAGRQHDGKKTHITPCRLQLAMRNDEEFNKLLGKVTAMQGEVLPNIQAALLPRKTESCKAKSK